MDARQQDGPIYIPLESGVVRPVPIYGAQRTPWFLGIICLVMMCFLALYGYSKALYGVPLWFPWHGYWVWAFKRDPQYWDILIRWWFVYWWPATLYAAEGVMAPDVKIEASVPFRAEAI